jgi:hypothetical protein
MRCCQFPPTTHSFPPTNERGRVNLENDHFRILGAVSMARGFQKAPIRFVELNLAFINILALPQTRGVLKGIHLFEMLGSELGTWTPRSEGLAYQLDGCRCALAHAWRFLSTTKRPTVIDLERASRNSCCASAESPL